jgi:quinate dehydrogenase (quinone)
MNTDSKYKLPRGFSILLCIIAAPMVLGGLQLVFLGGTFYYLLAGLVLVASAICLWRGAPLGSLIYGGLLIATLAWALMESGTHLWALAARILPLAVLGLCSLPGCVGPCTLARRRQCCSPLPAVAHSQWWP